MGISVDGIANLDRRLKTLKVRVQKKLVRNALTAGMRIVAKAIKAQVPSKWKAGRKAVGQSVKVDKVGLLVGKAGVGVGMKIKRFAKMRAEAKFNRSGKRKGVGLGVANFHWFAMGTEPRYTGEKMKTTRTNGIKTKTKISTGHARKFTGRMKKTPMVQNGFRASKSQAAKTIETNFMAAIEREVAKL